MKNTTPLKIPVIIDCDPGHDDAIALILAFASEKLSVKGVTTTAGNQTIEKTTTNACKILSLLQKESIPLGIGLERPIARSLEIAPSVHGKTGLDGPDIPETTYKPCSKNAIELIKSLLEASPIPITLIATGPLTNIGMFLLSYPILKNKIERISIMGGGINHGNWTSAAEFNILVDPEAADIVFSSGIPILMNGLDVTEKALVYPDEIEEFRQKNLKIPILIAELLDFFMKFHKDLGFKGAPLHDPCAVASIIAPELFSFEDFYVEIETQGKYTTGMTIADRRINNNKKTPNVKAVMNVDRRKFVDLLLNHSCRYTF